MKVKIATILISIAFIVAVVGPYGVGVIPALIPFLIGLSLLWKSEKTKQFKLRWTVTPILLWFPVWFVVSILMSMSLKN